MRIISICYYYKMSNFLTFNQLSLKNNSLLVMAIKNFSSGDVCYLGRSVFIIYIIPILPTRTWLHNTEEVFLAGIGFFYLLVE